MPSDVIAGEAGLDLLRMALAQVHVPGRLSHRNGGTRHTASCWDVCRSCSPGRTGQRRPTPTRAAYAGLLRPGDDNSVWSLWSLDGSHPFEGLPRHRHVMDPSDRTGRCVGTADLADTTPNSPATTRPPVGERHARACASRPTAEAKGGGLGRRRRAPSPPRTPSSRRSPSDSGHPSARDLLIRMPARFLDFALTGVADAHVRHTGGDQRLHPWILADRDLPERTDWLTRHTDTPAACCGGASPRIVTSSPALRAQERDPGGRVKRPGGLGSHAPAELRRRSRGAVLGLVRRAPIRIFATVIGAVVLRWCSTA